MKIVSKHLLLVLTGAALTLIPALGANTNSVVEFTPEEAKSLEWRVVNDGVMGGLSKGKLEIINDGILKFSGNLSLENNGGFSSIRTRNLKKDLSAANGVVARVRGDGRTYQIRFSTEARFRGMEISFMAEFKTKKDQWTEIQVPFDQFTGSFRGMKLKDEKFKPSEIRRLGLLIADKKTGPFDLKVDWIRTYGAGGLKDIVSAALADGRFGTLGKALTEAKLVESLQGEGPFTVFAPTDKAFAKLPKGTVENLLKPENRNQLNAVLTYHVVGGSVKLGDALKAGQSKTVQGATVKFSFSDGQVKVNEAAVLNADIACKNGVIHVIDSVILPPKPPNDLLNVVKRSGKFNTLVAAVKTAVLSDFLSGTQPITLLAPTDKAFANLPEGTVENLLKPENRERLTSILTLHALSGKVSAGDALNTGIAKALSGDTLEFNIADGTFQVNGVTISKTDIKCDNGIIHILDAVLLPPANSGERQSKSKSPLEKIEMAIKKGVPIFNDGDHEKCAAIYRDCLVSVSKTKEMDPRVSEVLTELVKQSGDIDCATRRAWMLRTGLDHVYAALSK
jgi:uncharacterized surface protein with fasciclin (FAS1) repeats